MEKNPMLKFADNEPKSLRLIKNWGSDRSKSGDVWQGWEVIDTETNTTYSLFVYDEALQKSLQLAMTGGQEVVVTQKRNGKQVSYEVKEAFFDGQGRTPANQKTPEAIETYRVARRKALREAVEDVLSVALEVKDSKVLDMAGVRDMFNPDVIQKLVTTLLIDFQKRS